ncbi:DUF4381 domain-containing protein [Vibrio sp. ZSDE26]|uniref:DUF4381 domain-containing protein n=1 Tax=Vibrio amylolyticus TaxID=2847292 RepID=A0A9X1XKP2_9VIBR|nr:DUF4381 domain-containing protein [Vibrio amylolyticus]
MSSNNILLKDLIDPSLPQSISWLPSTIGWKVAMVALVAIVIWVTLRFYRQLKSESYRRKAIKTIKQASYTHPTTKELQLELRRINSVVKHVACFAYPNTQVAMLYGQQWVSFLNDTTATYGMDNQLLSRWQRDLYKPELEHSWKMTDLNRLKLLCITWIKTHDRRAYD